MGLKVDRPLELGGRVLVVRLPAQVAQPEREEAEPEVHHGVVAVRLGPLDQTLSPAPADPTESTVAPMESGTLQLRPLGRLLRRDRRGRRQEQTERDHRRRLGRRQRIHLVAESIGSGGCLECGAMEAVRGALAGGCICSILIRLILRHGGWLGSVQETPLEPGRTTLRKAYDPASRSRRNRRMPSTTASA